MLLHRIAPGEWLCLVPLPSIASRRVTINRANWAQLPETAPCTITRAVVHTTAMKGAIVCRNQAPSARPNYSPSSEPAISSPGLRAPALVVPSPDVGACDSRLLPEPSANSFIARVRSTDRFEINSHIKLTLAMERGHLFDPGTEKVLK